MRIKAAHVARSYREHMPEVHETLLRIWSDLVARARGPYCSFLQPAMVSRVIALGVVMDALYQVSVLGTFRPGHALVVAFALALVPYVLVRVLADHVMRAVMRVALFGLVLGIGTNALAAEPQRRLDENRWQVAVTPYLWGPSMDGDIEAGRFDADVSVSFSDVLDATNFMAMAALEARRGRFVTFVDVLGGELEDDETNSRNVSADVELKGILLDAKVGYRVFELPHSELRRNRLELDLLVGTRVHHLRNEIERSGPLLRVEVDETHDWIDALVGAGVRSQLSERIAFRALGDVGGFGIGSSCRFTWGVFAGLSLEASPQWAFSAGYKVLDNDRDDVDLRIHGPMLGVTYRLTGEAW
jgi:opacity protein-like surface antigen